MSSQCSRRFVQKWHPHIKYQTRSVDFLVGSTAVVVVVVVGENFATFESVPGPVNLSRKKNNNKKNPVELVLTFSSFSPPSLSRVQQLSSGRQRWGAAGQGEEEQEQWQPQEGGGPEIPEPGGGAAGDPTAAAQDPQQARSRQKMVMRACVASRSDWLVCPDVSFDLHHRVVKCYTLYGN